MLSLRSRVRPFAALLALSALTACADYTAPQAYKDPEETALERDPLEPFNRLMFNIHTALDQVVIRPLSSIYRGIVPEKGREAVSSALTNLGAPIDFANSFLQGDMQNTFAVFWRFTLNSTFGLAGLHDFAAKDAGLTARSADFGQTMAMYGTPSGPYLFLPVLGPSTLRDTFGRVVDGAFDPLTYAGDDWRWATYTRAGALVIDFRARNMKLIDDLYATSLDPYVTFRSGYLQRRASEIRQASQVSCVFKATH